MSSKSQVLGHLTEVHGTLMDKFNEMIDNEDIDSDSELYTLVKERLAALEKQIEQAQALPEPPPPPEPPPRAIIQIDESELADAVSNALREPLAQIRLELIKQREVSVTVERPRGGSGAGAAFMVVLVFAIAIGLVYYGIKMGHIPTMPPI